MKRLVLAGAASIAAAALSLFVGGGVAQAQEAPATPQPIQISAVNILDALDIDVPEAPANPGAPVNEVLSFLADSIAMVGRDVFAKRTTEVADSFFGTVETATLMSDTDPADEPAEGTDLKALAIKAAPFAAIPILGVIGGVAGAIAGGVGGAAVAVFAGLAAAALVIAPAVIAGVGIALFPALAIAAVGALVGALPALIFLVAGIVTVVSAIVVGLLVITWPVWVTAGAIMIGVALAGLPADAAFPPLAIAGIVLAVLGLLPVIVLVVAGLLFGVAAVIALLSLPLVGLSVLIFTIAAFLFLAVVALVGSLGLLPAIVAFVVVGGIAAVVTLPAAGVVGFAAGGVLGAILGAIIALVWTYVIGPRTKKEEENEPAANQDDFALAA